VNVNRTHLFLLHFIVFIWGWTAILGQLVTLPADQLVWIRMAIALMGIVTWLAFTRRLQLPGFRNMLIYLGTGLIVGLHWICFYGGIKLSNASVVLAVFASGSLFTAFIEPLFFKRKIRAYEIVSGVLVILALGLIFGFEARYTWGIVLGILAAFTSSIFGVINGWLVRTGHSGSTISVYEMAGGFAGLTVYMLFTHPVDASLFTMSAQDLGLMLILGIGCTTLPFLISLSILKSISPYTVSLTLNLESVYGIILSYFIFHDRNQLSVYFYIGTVIILSTLFLNAWFSKRMLEKS
jgi:drug/metabolite transporter (DMT)-like permease